MDNATPTLHDGRVQHTKYASASVVYVKIFITANRRPLPFSHFVIAQFGRTVRRQADQTRDGYL